MTEYDVINATMKAEKTLVTAVVPLERDGGRQRLPSEEELLEVARAIARSAQGKRVCVNFCLPGTEPGFAFARAVAGGGEPELFDDWSGMLAGTQHAGLVSPAPSQILR